MRFKGLISGIGISSAILVSSFFLTNCTCYISEEDLGTIKDLRKQERSAAEEIGNKKKEKAGLERELSARQSEVSKCNEDRDFVKKKLAQWPNVWPDYTPEPEPEPESE